MNFASLCFASKQTLLNRTEAKNLKQKKAKKSEKMQKIAKNSEKKWKKTKKILEFCFALKQKVLKCGQWSILENLLALEPAWIHK